MNHSTGSPDLRPWRQIRGELAEGCLRHALPAAFVCSVIAVVFALVDATLLFAGPFPDALPVAVGMTLVGKVVVVGVVTLTSGFRGVIAGGQESAIIILAALVTDFVARFPPDSDPRALFANAVFTVTLATLALGVGGWLAGHYRLGRFIHYVPWSVTAGFLGGTGLVLMLAALPVLGAPTSVASLLAGTVDDPVALALGVLLAVLLALSSRHRAPHLVLLGLLALALVGPHLLARLAGGDVEWLREHGWTLAPASAETLWPALTPDDLRLVDWSLLLRQIPLVLTFVGIALAAMLMNVGALTQMLDEEVDEDRELRATGLANVLSAAALGVPGFHTLALTRVAQRMGPPRRVTGLLVFALCLLAVPLAGHALAWFPRFAFGGLVLWIGADLLVHWLRVAHRSPDRLGFAVVLTITLVIGGSGFLDGILVGLLAAVLLFVIDCARIDVVRQSPVGLDCRSNVDRGPRARRALARCSDELLVLRLHGYLFFGTVQRFVERLRGRLADRAGPVRFVLVDLEKVVGIDTSAIRAFERLRARGRDQGFTLLLSGGSDRARVLLGGSVAAPSPASSLAAARVDREVDREGDPGGDPGGDPAPAHFDTLDDALEWYEEGVLERHAVPDERTVPLTLGSFLEEKVDAATERAFMRYVQFVELDAGASLIRRNSLINSFYVVQRGSLSVYVDDGEAPARVRRVGTGAVIGEISMYLDRPTSADVVAETPSRLWRLARASLETMLHEDPALASRFHRRMATVLAERLTDNARLIRLLSS